MKKLASLFRVRQWYKNLVVFIPLFFSGGALNPALFFTTLLGFACLCMVSSSYYILNDIHDLAEDRAHPEKRRRAIASGEVSVAAGKLISLLLLAGALTLAYTLKPAFAAFVLALFASSTLYTLWLRSVAFVDVHVIAVNFLIRAVSGAALISVPASAWLIASVFFMALLLALAKRRSELALLGAAARRHKKVYRVYTIELLDSLILLVSAVLIFTYGLYTFVAYEHQAMMLTIPFATFMTFRYLYFVHAGKPAARKTELIFSDTQMLAAFILWVASSLAILGVFK